MQVQLGIQSLRPEWTASVACLGVFDGLHLGHQAVISSAVERARACEAPCLVVTFDQNPLAVVRPDQAPPAVATMRQNLEQMERLGASIAVVLPFDETLRQTSASDFYERVLVGALRVKTVVVGHDFRFGHDRQGDAAWLSERVETLALDPVYLEGERVSSTRIRGALKEGRVDLAASLLGRPYELEGIVVSGQRLGRTLGYPTLNLARSIEQALPGDGVYAGVCQTPVGPFRAAISVGERPSVGGRSVEAYLLDYPGDSIYGASVRLRFDARLRGQEKYDSLDALRAAIAADVEQVRALA